MECILYVLDKLWAPFIALIAALWVNQKIIESRKPRLEMVPEGIKPNSWKLINESSAILSETLYHMWRIKVQHTKIPWYLKWLIKNREPALQCKADLTFYNSKDEAIFIMQGRWANTPEISLISPSNRQEKMVYPDTISIGFYSPEPLDCIVKFDNENVAYGWNNEAYSTNGRTPRYKLGIGTYKVLVRLSGQNFQQVTKKLNFTIAERWEETSLTLTGD